MANRKDNMVSRIAVGALSSQLEVGAEKAPAAAERLCSIFRNAGMYVENLGSIDTPQKATANGRLITERHIDAIVLVATSWYEDYLVLDMLEESNIPLLLWSIPGMETGALCGTQQLTAYLKQLEIQYSCIYDNLDCEKSQQKAKDFIAAATLKRKLRRTKIGSCGYHVRGMTEVAVNEIALKKTIGPRVVNIDMPQLLKRTDEISTKTAAELWEKVISQSGCCKVAESDGLNSMKFYVAFKELIEEFELDAITIGCYPDFMGKVCLGGSLLADEGIPLACEGDVNGAVGQMILTWLSGQPTHNTDWLEPLEDGSIVFSHCGNSSFSLAENRKDITLQKVRLANYGACAVFPAKPGGVTMLNLLPVGNEYQIALLEGQAVSTEMVFPGNPLRVNFNHAVEQIIDWIHSEGIGHHWMAGYGSLGNKIRQWAQLCGPTVRLLELL